MTDNNKKTHIIVTGKGGGGSGSTDWNDITNKPDFATVATSGSYEDLENKPTILTQWFGTQAEYDAIAVKDPNVVYNIEGSDNVQADWNQTDTTADDYIKNKPTIPAAQVQTDWNQNDTTAVDYIKNKPTIPSVPAMATQELTFTLQGGTTKTIEFYTVPNYFYVEDISGSDNTLHINKNYTAAPTVEVFKSTDKINWTSMGETSTNITATVPANSKLYLKATTNSWAGSFYGAYTYFYMNGNYNIGGNIMSLLYGDNFENKTTFASGSAYNFYNLFGKYNTKLVSAADLVLPATTLNTQCYSTMFQGCTSLTTAPALPATTMANSCYSNMFQGCTSLTTAPALPATTMANSCYSRMFDGCTALTTAPVLPATTLNTQCYSNMFYGCTSLTAAPALPATTLKSSCYSGMFDGCTALTTAPALPATTLINDCYSYMFYGCTSLTETPELPATTLNLRCYQQMFDGCTSLNKVTTYAPDITATDCIKNWLNNTAATGDFYNLGGATYPSGVSGIPTGWTEHTSL